MEIEQIKIEKRRTNYMETNEEEQVNTSEKQVIRNEKGQIVSGTPNPNGRPKGSKNFETDFLEAVGKIAEANNITRVEAMEILLRKAYSEAKNGQFNFYQDIMNRLYGKVVEKTDITSKGESIIFQISKEIASKNDITPTPENNSQG